MYPLRTLLIGCADDILGELRRELAFLSVPVESEFVDVRSCLEFLLNHPGEKRLLIHHPRSAADIQQLEHLNETAVGQPILALVNPAHDPTLMVRAMRGGAAQVVRLPLEADDMRAAITRIAIQFGHSLNPCRTIVVWGATEGSGATTISLNLAAEIGRLRNAPCLLAEGAVGFGRLATYLGLSPQITLRDLLADVDHLDVERFRRAIIPVTEHLHVVTGSHGSIVPVNLTTASAFKLLACAQQLEEVIVVDGRYSFEELDFEFVAHIQQLVIVAQPTVPSLFGLRRILDQLIERGCLTQTFFVINRMLPNVKEFSTQAIENVLNVPKVFPVANDWRSFQAAENGGTTVRKAVPHCQAAQQIDNLARAILGMPELAPQSRWSLVDSWRHLTHAFSN